MGYPIPSSWILVVIKEDTGEKAFAVPGKRYFWYRGKGIFGTGEKVFAPFSWILVVVIQGTGEKVFAVPGKRYLPPFSRILVVITEGTGEKVFAVPGKRYRGKGI